MGDDEGRGTARRRTVDVPLLVAVAAAAWLPFLQFIYANRLEVLDVAPVLLAGAVTCGLALAVAVLASRWRDPIATTAVVVIVLVLSFSFGPFERALGGWVALACWLVLTGALATTAARIAAGRPAARSFLVAFGGVAAAIGLVPLVLWELAGPEAAAPDLSSDEVFVDQVAAGRPDVYLFILDAYARHDHLLDDLGYDNTAMLEALGDLGFVVADDSRSAYPITPLSVASLFEADHPVVEPAQLARGLNSFGPVMTGENRTVRTFTALGYDYWYANPGKFDAMRCEPALHVRCLPVNVNEPPGGEVGVLLSQLTPLAAIPAFDPPLDLPDPVDIVAMTTAPPDDSPPRFVHAHLMDPHIPFRVHADCSPRDDPIDENGPRQGRLADAYREQITCLDATLVEAMTALVAADPDAIVAIVSDHGEWFTSEFPGADAGPDELEQRFGNLSALRAPGCDVGGGVRELPSLFPAIFSCLSGTEVPAPAARRFYVDYEGTVVELDDALHPVG